MEQTSLCIVEDEKDLLDLYSDFLGDRFKVRGFSNAQDFFTAMDQSYSPDVILTDIKLPDRTGLGLIEEVRKKDHQKPVIVMSGYATKDHAMGAIKQRAYGFLEKPFKPEELLTMVEKAVTDHSSTLEMSELLSKHFSFSKNCMKLIHHYRERYLKAENLLYEAKINLFKNKKEMTEYFAKCRTENQLELAIDKILRAIKRLS